MPAGGENLYRKFGIAEDADYDEIVAAYERLRGKSADDKKELIRLEVAKDRILEDRLRQRMSGGLRSKVSEGNWDRAQRFKPKKAFNEYLPPYVRQFFEVPSRDFRTNVSIFFAMLGGFALALPAMASAVMMAGYLVSNGVLFNKGLPAQKEDMARPAEAKPLLITLAISTTLGGLGFSVGVGLSGALFPGSPMAVRARARGQPARALAPLPTGPPRRPAPAAPAPGERPDLLLHSRRAGGRRALLQSAGRLRRSAHAVQHRAAEKHIPITVPPVSLELNDGFSVMTSTGS